MTPIQHNANIYHERGALIRQYQDMIREVDLKDQKQFRLHLSELPQYERGH